MRCRAGSVRSRGSSDRSRTRCSRARVRYLRAGPARRPRTGPAAAPAARPAQFARDGRPGDRLKTRILKRREQPHGFAVGRQPPLRAHAQGFSLYGLREPSREPPPQPLAARGTQVAVGRERPAPEPRAVHDQRLPAADAADQHKRRPRTGGADQHAVAGRRRQWHELREGRGGAPRLFAARGVVVPGRELARVGRRRGRRAGHDRSSRQIELQIGAERAVAITRDAGNRPAEQHDAAPVADEARKRLVERRVDLTR
jgi:hypothetical protein